MFAGRVSVAGALPDNSAATAVLTVADVIVGRDAGRLDDLLSRGASAGDPQLGRQFAVLAPVSFVGAGDTIDVAGRGVVVQAAEILHAHPSLTVRIQGYTDALGDAGADLALSLRRANSVFGALVDDGIPAAQLTIRGSGSADPASVGTPPGQTLNRGVTFVVLS